jgi:hypothetical protein
MLPGYLNKRHKGAVLPAARTSFFLAQAPTSHLAVEMSAFRNGEIGLSGRHGRILLKNSESAPLQK